MDYRILGRTGIKVSEVGMGCEGFSGKEYPECEKLLDCAMAQGINFFDVYTSDPHVRKNLGKALSRYERNSFVIQGHFGTAWKDNQYCRTRDIDEVKEAFGDLLKFMQLDYVDVGMVHYGDDKQDFERIMTGPILDYAKQLKNEGVIGCIGLSTHNQEIAHMAVDSGVIDVIMLSINPAYDMLPPCEDVDILFKDGVFDRVYEGIDPVRDRLYKHCQANGVALTVMKAFAGGLLLDEKQTPFGQAMTPVQCISYCLDRPAVAAVLGGMASVDEVKAAVSYCSASDAEKDYGAILASAPKSSFNGHCMYCGHCAPCSVAIDIAAVNKYLDLANAQGTVTETLRDHYDILQHHAGECIACGHCESNCPFGVKIMEKMNEAAVLFGK